MPPKKNKSSSKSKPPPSGRGIMVVQPHTATQSEFNKFRALMSGNRKKSQIPRILRMPGENIVRKYMFALTNPFARAAEGVRLPFYPNPSATPITIRWSGEVVMADFLPANGIPKFLANYLSFFLPSPALAGYVQPSPGVSYTTEGSLVAHDNTYRPQYGPVVQVPWTDQGASTKGIPGFLVDRTGVASTNPVIKDFATAYRPVAGGVRLMNITPVSTPQYTVHTSLCSATDCAIPYWIEAGNGSAAPLSGIANLTDPNQNFKNHFGCNIRESVQHWTGSDSLNVSSYELTNNPLQLCFQPTSPSAFRWIDSEVEGDARITGNSGTSYDFNEENLVASSTGSFVSVGADTKSMSSKHSNFDGWNCPVVSICPTVTSAGLAPADQYLAIRIEGVLHLEIVPLMYTYFSNGAAVPANPSYEMPATVIAGGDTSSHIPRLTVEQILAAVNQAGDYVSFAMSAYRRFGRALSGVAGFQGLARQTGAHIEL